MDIVERPSPNFGTRRDGIRPDMLILHYTGMQSAAAAIDRLRDPAAEVSAHYLIDEDGTVYRLVDDEHRAWHAGKSWWAGETDINSRSIGIEVQNPGHEYGYRAFPEIQIAATIDLCRDLLARHAIPPRHVLGHSDIAPGRKKDPGNLFPWQKLAENGIGLWPRPVEPATGETNDVKFLLAQAGYNPDLDENILRAAFRDHWNPRGDLNDVHILHGLLHAQNHIFS